MKKTNNVPIPVKKALRKLGQDISDARRRRRITMELMAERAGISRTTLHSIEKGESSVSMGAYASALFTLGLIGNLQQLADVGHDLVGHELEAEQLPQRIRRPVNKEGNTDGE
jgi:DNA-binding XRE family transcriptional regulator